MQDSTGCPGDTRGSVIVQFSSVAQSSPTLSNPVDCSTPGFSVHYQLPKLAQSHVHRVSDAIQPSRPLSSPSPNFNLSQHQGLFQRVSSSYQVAKVLEVHALEKEMATHSSVLAWRIPGTGSLAGCHLWGRTESDTIEATYQQQQQHGTTDWFKIEKGV